MMTLGEVVKTKFLQILKLSDILVCLQEIDFVRLLEDLENLDDVAHILFDGITRQFPIPQIFRIARSQLLSHEARQLF